MSKWSRRACGALPLLLLCESGKHIPRDFSVIGFDGVAEGANFWPPLTTIRQNFGAVSVSYLTWCYLLTVQPCSSPNLIRVSCQAATPAAMSVLPGRALPTESPNTQLA